jgi:hypothetical protein
MHFPEFRRGGVHARIGSLGRSLRSSLISNSKQPPGAMTSSQHVYEVRPRKDHRGFDLISDALPFGRLWYGEPNAVSNAVDYAKFRSRSHNAVIRVYDAVGNVIEAHEHAGDFKRVVKFWLASRGTSFDDLVCGFCAP